MRVICLCMAIKKRKKKSRRRSFGDGYAYEFHGSFTKKADAETKTKALRRKGLDAWSVSRKVFHGPSGLRHVVMTRRVGDVPF